MTNPDILITGATVAADLTECGADLAAAPTVDLRISGDVIAPYQQEIVRVNS